MCDHEPVNLTEMFSGTEFQTDPRQPFAWGGIGNPSTGIEFRICKKCRCMYAVISREVEDNLAPQKDIPTQGRLMQ